MMPTQMLLDASRIATSKGIDMADTTSVELLMTVNQLQEVADSAEISATLTGSVKQEIEGNLRLLGAHSIIDRLEAGKRYKLTLSVETDTPANASQPADADQSAGVQPLETAATHPVSGTDDAVSGDHAAADQAAEDSAKAGDSETHSV